MHNIKSIGKHFPKMLMLLLPLGGAMAQSVHIGPNASLVASGSVYITLNNMGIVNDGTFTGNNGSVLKFAGSASSSVSSIGGSHAYTLGNLNVSKSSADVALNQDVTINNGLGLVLGNLVVNNHTITLGPTGGITKEDETDRIIGSGGGSIVVTRTFSPNIVQNPGNIGVELKVSGATSTTVTVTRTLFPETLGDGTIGSIDRGFTISTGTGTISPYNARFFYFNNELETNDPSRLNMWSVDPVGNSNLLGRDSNNVTAKWVALGNLAQTGHFVLGDDPTGIILPGGNSILHKADATDNVAASVKVYPNPVHNNFNMSLTMTHEKDVVLSLTDQKGTILQQKKVHCGSGVNTITWNMSAYAAGTYFIVIDNAGMKNIKIVKE